MARAYAEHDPALLAIGRRLVSDGILDDLRGASVEDVLECLWTDLCEVSEPRLR